jgi:hypothetical protein
VCFVGDLEEKEMLLASEPKKFRTTAHYDGYPTVLLHLPSIGKRELRELITESWRIKAPPKLVKELDAARMPDAARMLDDA